MAFTPPLSEGKSSYGKRPNTIVPLRGLKTAQSPVYFRGAQGSGPSRRHLANETATVNSGPKDILKIEQEWKKEDMVARNDKTEENQTSQNFGKRKMTMAEAKHGLSFETVTRCYSGRAPLKSTAP
ncbi:uncharacterized protein V1513DRAFT_484274 [Lipomyces chichibuensis]|uniref:uncharacterized protein n=1 Tax=Lipomyces chichibuensis TaxID=1546026 RepID=UPI00334411A0